MDKPKSVFKGMGCEYTIHRIYHHFFRNFLLLFLI